MDIKKETEKFGFHGVSFLDIHNPSYRFQIFYKQYIKKKFHAKMKYLENTKSKFNLQYFCSDKTYPFKTRSMMVALHPYRHTQTEDALTNSPYKIARYAWGVDYHIYLKNKLVNALKGNNQDEYRIVIDSTPLPERYYARKARLGFIGKNGMLINPRFGSYFLLVFVFFSQKLSSSTKNVLKKNERSQSFTYIDDTTANEQNYTPQQDIKTWCEGCNLCVASCPTNALSGNGEVNSNQCISYWNIESQSDSIMLEKKGKWIFGCDICQKVCPYNKNGIFTLDKNFAPHPITRQVAQGDLSNLRKASLGNLPLKRAGLKNLERNIKFFS